MLLHDQDHSDNDAYLINMQNLKICRTCYALYGSILLEGGKKVTQKCLCHPQEGENWIVGIGEYKTRYDYNQKYETCYCCGLRIIESGSRWSSFYCSDCKSRIAQLNIDAGQCIIPVGRHSLMNGVFFDNTAPIERRDQASEEFVTTSNNMFSLIDRTDNYRKIILQKQIDRVGLSQAGTAFDFIILVRDLEDEISVRDEAFLGLLACVTGWTREKAKRFYTTGRERDLINPE